MDSIDLQPKLYPLPKNTGKSVLLHHYYGHPDFLYHYHPEYELVLTRGTVGKRIIGGSIQEYYNRDLVLLGADIPHTWVSEKQVDDSCVKDNVVLHFTRESVGLDLLLKEEFRPINGLLENSFCGIAFSARTIERAEVYMDRICQQAGMAQLMSFIELLDCLASSEEAGRTILPDPFDQTYHQILSQVFEYIYKYHSRAITLAEIASEVHMSVPTFTRFFRKATGKTFVEYLNEWRVRRSCVLLRETDRSVLDISLKVGFSNLSHFNRQFLRLTGMTPRAYRNRRNG